MTQGVRYKFIGSTIEVSIGLGGVSPSPAISGISLTNPAIVSTAPTAHGMTTGDVAELSSITGATQFNDNLYVVDDYTPTDFSLANEDNSNGAAWVSGGRVAEVTFSEFCELTGANQQGGGADQEEVSTVCSTAKEFEQGLADTGTLTLDFNYAPLTSVQTELREAELSGEQMAFRITLPNGGGTIVMIGTVTTTSFNGAIGQAIWKGNAAIKLSGPVFVLETPV